MELTMLIRQAIRDSHDAIEGLPISKAMLEGTLDRATYVQLLQLLKPIHQAIEQAAAVLQDILPPCTFGRPRSECIKKDLAYFGAQETHSMSEEVLDLRRQFEEWSERRRAALLGAIYVIEGSRMGSMVLARSLAQTFGVSPTPGNGLDYHVDGMADLPRKWGQFKGMMNALGLSHEDRIHVLDGAVMTMDGLCSVYASVGQIDETGERTRSVLQESVA